MTITHIRITAITIAIVIIGFPLISQACGGGGGNMCTCKGNMCNTGQHVTDAASGREIYQGTCINCHGVNGKGVVNFTAKDGRLSKSDDVLIKHIMEGFRSSGSRGMAMPPKGGNQYLTEEGAEKVLQYLRKEFQTK